MFSDVNIENNFTKEFNKFIYEYKNNDYSDIIFLCIGTDRITGDAYGPLVGNKLTRLFENINNEKITVIGTLKKPLNAINIKEVLKDIKSKTEKPYIIAIDSAFSKKENIGKIILSNSGMYIGKGLNKKSDKIGNISIKGVVAKDYKIPKVNFAILQNTSLGLIMDLADYTADNIFEVIKYA